MSEQEIRAKNLPGLLKFCLAADDGTKPTQMDPEELKEKSEWFHKFVQESSINFGKKMMDDLELLSLAIRNNKIDDSVFSAFEELQDITENVDFAKDFIKMGGFEVVRRVIELNIEDLTVEGAQLIGNVTQNDEVCQTAAINDGMVPFLLSRIVASSSGKEIKRLVYALSCCIRGSSCGIEEFKLQNGLKIILDSLTIDKGEATAKCAFLLYCTISEHDSMKLSEQELRGVVERVLELAEDLSQDGCEHLLGLIKISLSRDKSLSKCFSVASIERLETFLRDSEGKEEYEDSAAHIGEIINYLK